MPVLCWAFWLPKTLLWAAGAAEASALLLALVSWRVPLSKATVIGAAAGCLIGAWVGSRGFPTYPMKVHPSARWMQPLDSIWLTQSPAKPYSIRTTSDLRRNGEDSLRFEMRPGDTWINRAFTATCRDEISTEQFPPAISTRWYALSLYLPTNFPIEDVRLILAQWHGRWQLWQPGRIPPLSFRFVNGRFFIPLRYNAERIIRDPSSAPGATLFETSSFALGRWHDFIVQAKWSCREDGFVNIWWNNKQIVAYRGPVGYDEATGPELKFGLYRDDTDKTYVACFNHVKLGLTAADVGFEPPGTAP